MNFTQLRFLYLRNYLIKYKFTLLNLESINLKVLLHKFPIFYNNSLLFLAAKSVQVKTESLFSGLILSK